MALPAISTTPDFTKAVYCVPYASVVDGVKIAVVPEYVMVQGTVALPSLSVKATVDQSTGSLKRTPRAAIAKTLRAPLAGLVDDTPGGVVSGAVPVMKI